MASPSSSSRQSNASSPPPLTAGQVVGESLKQLIEILELESVLTQELAAQAQEVQKHLLRDDIPAMLSAGQELETISGQLSRTEQFRVRLVRRLAPYFPELPRSRLAEWHRYVPEPFASRIAEIHRHLQTAAVRAQQLNRQNKALIQRSLRFAEMALGLEPDTYSHLGGRAGEGPTIFDRTV